MDELNSLLGGLTGGGAGGDGAAAIGKLATAIQEEGGLDELVGKLQSSGQGGTVDSWVGTGANAPVDPQQLGAALGPDQVQRLSTKSGIDIASLLPMLAAFLPQIIDMLTPDGKVPDGGLNQAAQQNMPDIGSMIGGMLGGAGGRRGRWCRRPERRARQPRRDARRRQGSLSRHRHLSIPMD